MDNDTCLALIELYKSKEVLWNPVNKDYHNKNTREDAWKDISSIMKIPSQELKKKMTSLLASYRREKSRVKKSYTTGSAAGTGYVSKWFAFHEFEFMADKNTPNETVDTLQDECETSQSDQTVLEQNEEAATEGVTTTRSPEAPPPKKRIKDRKSANSAAIQQNQAMLVEAFDILKSSATASTDPYFSYGQHIANELRKYDPRTLALVKHAINNVIFDADMGKYSYKYAVEGPPTSIAPQASASS